MKIKTGWGSFTTAAAGGKEAVAGTFSFGGSMWAEVHEVLIVADGHPHGLVYPM